MSLERRNKMLECKCECEGGFERLSDDDLKMLFNIMRKQTNDVARGTRIAIRAELAKREKRI